MIDLRQRFAITAMSDELPPGRRENPQHIGSAEATIGKDARCPPSKGASLPPRFAAWFERPGWRPHDHQPATLEAAGRGSAVLLIAPTGGGKTLAGFLPGLVVVIEIGKERVAGEADEALFEEAVNGLVAEATG